MSKIILVGKAASGKDHLRKILEGKGFKYGVSFTTRPPREGEVEGRDYYFLSEDQFKDLINNDDMFEYVEFNRWFYGTTKKQFYKTHNLFIMTPMAVNRISPIDRKNCFIIYLDISDDIRRKRLKERSDSNDSLERRMKADYEDFKDFKNYDIRITDPNF